MTHPAPDPAPHNALGLAVGSTTLVAARPGRQPVTRRAAGAGGSTPLDAGLTVTALAEMARAVDGGAPPAIVVAAPAYWGPDSLAALQAALRANPVLSPSGAAPLIVSDYTAALAALQQEPGLPAAGVVAVCDFGGGGSSITLTDAGAGFSPIGGTVRVPDLAGDRIDEALADAVLARLRTAGHTDPAETAPVGTLLQLRDGCRLAKEQLSTETGAVVPVDLPSYRTEMRISRTELDALLEAPFAAFLDALADSLERQRIPVANLAAVAIVGGGAAIPLIGRRLSEQLRVPLITTRQPGLAAAVGAAVIAAGGDATQTGPATAAPDEPTSLAPTAWAAGAAGAAATQSASDGAPSATYRALAWSQDDEGAGEPVPYTGEDYSYTPPPVTDPVIGYRTAEQETVVTHQPGGAALDPWYRRPALLFGISAVLAALAVGGLAITLTSGESTPTTTTTRVTKPGEPAASTSGVPAPQTVTVTGGNGQTTVTTITPTTTAATSTTSTTTPTTTTTTPTTTTTTTTTPTTTTTTPTTTTTTTTTPTTTRTTTTTTSVAPPTTTTVEPPPTTADPVITTQAVTTEFPLPTLKPAPEE